ncbi:LLM class flavin-dependent oxidoreductase [Mesorhizobium sp. ES1-4]|uniref:LLM class flavin-dependent oxidoreductase n=1 Tax=Mesorhizobium sp. ES1-4 TaxID=2876627 RepID=UPI001CCE9556|nr:LLM class flavin-dependent oxidoreductase [Mesorhizobium sp. ES1-4]MBZ9795274.1 LLM class flavin-dependent oxidoreductase [Mesorhizobium sp. ES1-4]
MGRKMHLAVSLDIASAAGEAGPTFGEIAASVRNAERAGINMVIICDTLPGGKRSTSLFEATTLVAALATVTERIGLLASASTVAHQPYNLARRFASLDIISHGRAGWNATMTQAPGEAGNFSRPQGFSDDDFRRRTAEYIGIVQGLWNGWDADALVFDKRGGRFHEPEKMRLLDHKGEFFSVRGPLNVARSPQDTPVLALSGLSEPDFDIAARTADVILLDDEPFEAAKTRHDELKRRAATSGRDPDAVKVLMNVSFSADDKPATVAGRMADRFQSKACDGFNIQLPARSSALDGFVDGVLPELRRGGLFREGYSGTILRSHLGLAVAGDQ